MIKFVWLYHSQPQHCLLQVVRSRRKDGGRGRRAGEKEGGREGEKGRRGGEEVVGRIEGSM